MTIGRYTAALAFYGFQITGLVVVVRALLSSREPVIAIFIAGTFLGIIALDIGRGLLVAYREATGREGE